MYTNATTNHVLTTNHITNVTTNHVQLQIMYTFFLYITSCALLFSIQFLYTMHCVNLCKSLFKHSFVCNPCIHFLDTLIVHTFHIDFLPFKDFSISVVRGTSQKVLFHENLSSKWTQATYQIYCLCVTT
jgi:hypothetical protein